MRFAAKLAAALAGLSPETKAALAALLAPRQSGAPKVSAPARRSRGATALLLDTRTVAELWLSGESPEARNRAEARATKGDYRSILVTFADGFSVRAGSYLADDEFAKAAAIRSARARAMEREFAAADARERVEGGAPAYPYRWAVVNGAHVARTRACEVPAVVSAELVQLVQIGEQFLIAEGEFCAVDFDKLRKRAAHEARIADCTARYEQRRARLLPVPLAFTPTADLHVRRVVSAADNTVSSTLTRASDCAPLADSSQTAVEARTEARVMAGPEVPAEPASLPERARRGGNRPSRGAGDYAVHTSSGFVLFVGSHRDAKKVAQSPMGSRPSPTAICRLPTGWRERSANVPFFANAKAWCDGTRQRINLSVVAA